MEDTEIFGCRVPKGTDVFMLSNGPGFRTAPLHVDEAKRSKTSQESIGKNGAWNPADIGEFQPERWLVDNEKGGLAFESRAGPALPFGGGPRGCFGRKLASLELKIIILLVVWTFDLLPIPESMASFAAKDMMTHTPQHCYVRLAAAK
ncbi:hypothetical protein LTR54_003128 [Friedmanniomyces endolithicus]|uniref:Uncharacterized protein n=1 Tax=Friedmanniomyces endolithicus TaxID=329885 RepID=A0AAN6G1M2_9PEZI|nr:hypothetical protein LTR82_001869 [Friedmanniomyces endolithicus]KAK1016450.1 hypothetical protein LTR54_003128 [Friedmanniomyces endolithicus]